MQGNSSASNEIEGGARKLKEMQKKIQRRARNCKEAQWRRQRDNSVMLCKYLRVNGL